MTFAFILDSVPFTRAVISGETSLGGSESACLGLARALVARGHDVHLYTTKIDEDCHGLTDAAGVQWFDYRTFRDVNKYLEYDVVIALRVFAAFGREPVNARLRLLWNQDLLVPGDMQAGIMAISWALDHIAYVSDYHKAQWEQVQPELGIPGFGWVTRNGYDPRDLPAASNRDLPAAAYKDPTRIIHISRPERGLAPLLEMWPDLKKQCPEATLQICRYSSMYDTGEGSWSEVCATFDQRIAAINEAVGGITYLGELNKTALYQAISDAAVMWYPGVDGFAETSCIAAIEAQACGTPFVGSYRGALPETIPSGTLIPGSVHSPSYREASITAVINALQGCKDQTFQYRKAVQVGLAHVQAYTYPLLAAEWEERINQWFADRYETQKIKILRQLLREDDHTSAKRVAEEIVADKASSPSVFDEALEAGILCESVIAGKEHTAETYGQHAMHDVLYEAKHADRFKMAAPAFEGRERVLDIACGNGAFAIALAWANPTVTVYGLDFSLENIDRARLAAVEAGVADRVTFDPMTIYDFDAQDLTAEFKSFLKLNEYFYDGLFCGEFIEHVANYRAVIDGLERAVCEGAQMVFSCPQGACQDIRDLDAPLQRSHVHRFHHDDIKAVWGKKRDLNVAYLSSGTTPRGLELGSWLIGYAKDVSRPTGERPWERIPRTRPLPTLSVGILAFNAANDIGRCLDSVRRIADEIIVGDTGSSDKTVAIAEEKGARVITLPSVAEHREGFAGARNAILRQASGDWFMWIDSDEQLMSGAWLRRYLDTGLFNGFVIRQTHLYVDGAPTQDIPVRVFRNNGTVQFYGCVHEQPQQGDCNGDIHPTLDIGDITLAHWGYLTPDGREQKRVQRNLPLLKRDTVVFPDRLLGRVLCIREAVLQADSIRERQGMCEQARQGYQFAVSLHVTHFDAPDHKYHPLSRPWYEAALRHLDVGWEQELAMAGRFRGLHDRRAKSERIWVRDADEFERMAAYKAKKLADQMRSPVFVTDPSDPRISLARMNAADVEDALRDTVPAMAGHA